MGGEVQTDTCENSIFPNPSDAGGKNFDVVGGTNVHSVFPWCFAEHASKRTHVGF